MRGLMSSILPSLWRKDRTCSLLMYEGIGVDVSTRVVVYNSAVDVSHTASWVELRAYKKL
jgi:hypothetical protein